MALPIVVGIAVLGLALVVVGAIAIRDEPPRWALRIKRPGWMLTLGLFSLVLAYLVNSGRFSIDEAVTDHVGFNVECDRLGGMDVEGERRDVHACVRDDGTHMGCFVRNGETVIDVSLRAEAEGVEGRTPDC